MEELLVVEGLTVEIAREQANHKVLDDISFTLHEGEIVGLVGESGCGKSITALAMMGLLPGVAKVVAGQVYYRGNNLLSLKEKDMCNIRGKDISIVFQEPMTALNPILPVGVQIAEAYQLHNRNVKRVQAKELPSI